MGLKNRRPDLNGILVIDKPLGLSSAGVCARIRRHSGGAKVGHAGTLDPLATGVLVVCLGTATRAIDQLMATAKRYRAIVDLSAFSTTDDAEGVRTDVAVPSPPTRERIEAVLRAQFLGEVMQAPPAFSAIKVNGERAYKMARRGDVLEMRARPVRIDSIDIVDYVWPKLDLDIRCGKGTYIRSLARDLGRALGTGGMLGGLRRTAVGRYTIETAQTLEALPAPLESGHLRAAPERGEASA